MNKKPKPKKNPRNSLRECSQCGARAVREVRRTRFHKGVLIENVPATLCGNCGEVLYDLATLQLLEEIAAEPSRYATLMELPVARVA